MERIQSAMLDIDDDTGKILFVSQRAASLLVFDYHDMIGRVAHDLIHHSYPDGSPFPEEHCQVYRAVNFGEALVTPFDVLWRQDGIALPIRYALTRLGAGDTVLSFIDLSDELERHELDVRAGVVGETVHTGAPLTVRERAILGYLLDSHTNQHIADALFLSEKTVRNLLSVIYLKLDVGGRSEAAVLWAQVSAKDDRR